MGLRGVRSGPLFFSSGYTLGEITVRADVMYEMSTLALCVELEASSFWVSILQHGLQLHLIHNNLFYLPQGVLNRDYID